MELQGARPLFPALLTDCDHAHVGLGPQISDHVAALRDLSVQPPIHGDLLIGVVAIHDHHDKGVSGQGPGPDLPGASEEITVDRSVHPAPDGVPAAAVLNTGRLGTEGILVDGQQIGVRDDLKLKESTTIRSYQSRAAENVLFWEISFG